MVRANLDTLRRSNPRIHCISNLVSAPLCANGLIAIGAAPIMADDLMEAAEITNLCDGLSLNLGMPNPRKLSAMLLSGVAANKKGIPVVFDPVGVGASPYRMKCAQSLMGDIQFTAIRGNLSEMKTLAGEDGHCLGVDAGQSITEENLSLVATFARSFAQKTGTIIAISSIIDVVSDGMEVYVVRNGHPMLSTLSGSGCLLSTIMTAFLAGNPDQPLLACVSALCAMGYCGELAAKTANGNGSFAVALLDTLSNLQGDDLERGAIHEVFWH